MESLHPAASENAIDPVQAVQWGRVFNKLVGRAAFITRQVPDVFDGVSVEDVVSEVFTEFFADAERLGWNPAIASLETFLWVIVRRLIIDHLRRARRNRSVDDETVRSAAEAEQRLTTDPRPNLDRADRVADLKSRVSGDAELERLISAAELADGPNFNQEMARTLDVPVTTVVNSKRRLQRSVKAKSKAGAP